MSYFYFQLFLAPKEQDRSFTACCFTTLSAWDILQNHCTSQCRDFSLSFTFFPILLEVIELLKCLFFSLSWLSPPIQIIVPFPERFITVLMVWGFVFNMNAGLRS